MTMQTLHYPTSLAGKEVVLGETQMGAIDYIRSFGGLVVDVLGGSDELKKLFPPAEKDACSGLLVTKDKDSLFHLAIDVREYFQKRCPEPEADLLRGGLRANFADFSAGSLPTALYTAVVQPKHKTATLQMQSLVRDNSGLIIGKEVPTMVDDPNTKIARLLMRLAHYHLITGVQSGQIRRAE
jgi:hypothetical protein